MASFFVTHKDDVPDAFCINGIEIDLKELEELERRVAAKKQQQAQSTSDKMIPSNESSDKLHDKFEKSLKISDENSEAVSSEIAENQPVSLASMFFVIMSIFSILNQIYYMPTAQRS
jgi:hypothetical protein